MAKPTKKEVAKKIVIKVSSTSKGRWKTFKGIHTEYTAFFGDTEVGSISVFKIKTKVFVNTVFVPYSFRGIGIGYKLYMHALTENKTLSTYYHDASDDAKNIWRKLVRKFKYETDFFKNELTIFKIN